MDLYDLPSSLKDDALTLLCLEELGSGLSRQVYTCTLNPQEWVVKVEFGQGYFQNIREWEVWNSVRHIKAISRWFAPCINISDCGRFLVQRRTQPVLDQAKLPKKVPRYFTDLKRQNWGYIGRRIVCHDYGTVLTTEYGISPTTRKADWWS